MSVLDNFLAGLPMEAPVIDVHMHLPGRHLYYRGAGMSKWHIPSLGSWEQHETFSNLTETVRHMDRVGLTKAFACINGFERLDEGFEIVRRYAGRFLPAVSFWPGMGKGDEDSTTTPGGRRVPDSRQELRAVLERVHRAGWRGIKMWEPRPPDTLTWLYEDVLGFAHENRLFVMHHSWGPPATLDRLAERYPNITMITGHSFEWQRAFDSFAPVVRKRRNIFPSTTNVRHPGSLEAMVKAFGAEKVMMGSDFVLHTLEFSIGNLAFARIPEQAKRDILGLNMQRLLKEAGYWDTWGYERTA